MRINRAVIEKELSKVFYSKSVKEIMAILIDNDGVTEDTVRLRPGMTITPSRKTPIDVTLEKVSQKEHKWGRTYADPPGRMKRYGGENHYTCKNCGAERHCSWAALPNKGCK